MQLDGVTLGDVSLTSEYTPNMKSQISLWKPKFFLYVLRA